MTQVVKTSNRNVIAMERRKKVAEMYLRNKTQWDIAIALDTTQATISRDLKWVRQRWLDAMLQNFDELKSKELAKIDRLENEYWEAWQRSIRIKQTKVEESSVGDNMKNYDMSRVTEVEELGDKGFLKGVEWCIKKRCEVLGFDAPKKLDVSWRKEVSEQGIKASEVFETMVNEYSEAIEVETEVIESGQESITG